MNAKIYNGNVQPNPKEYKIWVNDEGTIKTWNGTEWIENTAGGGGSGSGSSDGVKWEYYKIDRNDASYDSDVMGNVFSYVTLVNDKEGDVVFIMPRGQDFAMTAAIAGLSIKNIVGGSVVDTGSWLGNVKECDKWFEINYDYSFLKPITEEEFYSNNFDYPVPNVP